MNTLYQHIVVIILCIFYFFWGDKTIWIVFIILNTILGIVFSLKEA